MMAYNPNEQTGIPRIGVPRVGVPKVHYPNVFGLPTKDGEHIGTIDQPYLLWENGTPILWEDGTEMELEQQKMRLWAGR